MNYYTDLEDKMTNIIKRAATLQQGFYMLTFPRLFQVFSKEALIFIKPSEVYRQAYVMCSHE